MIESKYIGSVQIPEFDQEVNNSLGSIIDDGGNEMVTAIENFEGEIYRVIKTSGLGAYMNVVSVLADIGLEDTLAGNIYGKDGYDSWFIVADDLIKNYQASKLESTDAVAEILAELDSIPETEREAILKSRIGQGVFRERLISYWKGCAVTGSKCIPMLKASHIKPWRNSSHQERLDPFNGLLLTPNLDAAFDAGYISFDDGGKIMLSSKIVGEPAFQLHITPKLKINTKLLTHEHKKYMRYHRESVFLG
jgi:hypothetical protein